METVAPEMFAPLESRTVPETVCAAPRLAAAASSKAINRD
jgi:hypothetical protein